MCTDSFRDKWHCCKPYKLKQLVCQHFGIDTSDCSFAYVTGWSRDKELPELKASLECISKTAGEMITAIESACPALARTPLEAAQDNAFHPETHSADAR